MSLKTDQGRDNISLETKNPNLKLRGDSIHSGQLPRLIIEITVPNILFKLGRNPVATRYLFLMVARMS